MRERFWQENRPALRLWCCATGLAWLAAALWLALLVLLGAVVSRVFLGRQTLGDVAPAFAALVALACARAARSGELVHLLTQGVESLDEYISQFLPARLLAALVPALVLLVVALLDPWTLPVLLFAGPLRWSWWRSSGPAPAT